MSFYTCFDWFKKLRLFSYALNLKIDVVFTGGTTYVIHPGIFLIENFMMAEIFSPSDKIKLIFILFQQRTCMIKARPKYPMDLYGTIYIDNIQKVVVICLNIPGWTTYVVHPGIFFMLDPLEITSIRLYTPLHLRNRGI
jgi:hypothetical protein